METRQEDPDFIMNDESYAIGIAKNECDDNESRTELTNISGTNILTLNEYCLLDTFSCSSLTTMDLCSLAETCKRFKQIAECVFPKKFKMYSIFDKRYIFESSHKKFEVTVDDCERILRNFGSRLSEYSAYEDAVMDLVAKYCDGVALDHLTINDDENVNRIAAKLKSIFDRVQKLYIAENVVMDVEFVEIIRCDSLVELELDCSNGIVPFLRNNTFPKLRRFTVLYPRDRVCEFLFAFMSRHRLNYLEIYCDGCGWSELMHKIDESCKELKELRICFDGEAVRADFPKLQNLTKLEIFETEINIESFDALISLLRELKSLKTLILIRSHFEQHHQTQVFDILSQLPDFRELSLSNYANQADWSMLPKLKKLVLRYPEHGFCAADLQNIIKQLPNLEEFVLNSNLALSEDDFLAIVKIVQGRANVLTVECKFNFNYAEKCNENQNVKLRLPV